MRQLLLTLSFVACLNAQTITINAGTPLQTIDGFGAASAALQFNFTTAQNDFFYGTIGLSVDRIQIFPDLASCVGWIGAPGCVSVASGATVSTYDLADAQAAVARGALIVASNWSPPGVMKSNGSYNTGGSFNGGATNMTNLAALEASFVTLLTGAYGIPIYAISPQNEPEVTTSYPSCTWTAQQIHDYVPYLSAALASAGYSSTKIMIAEQGTWNTDYFTIAMNDATVAGEVGIIASHGYFSSASLLAIPNQTTQHVWQTEYSTFDAYDGSITNALALASQIHNYLTTAGVSGYLYWGMSAQSTWSDNEGLTDFSGNIAKRAYVMGNWAKFVRPGWNMTSVTNPSGTGLQVTAFQPSHTSPQIVLVVVNTGSAPTNQLFAANSIVGNVTPWITSATQNLEQQAPITATANSFTYTIPANSVVTFVANTPVVTPGTSLTEATMSSGLQIQ